MNIFEYLGLPANHRKSEKTTMKVKHFDEVPASKKLAERDYYVVEEKHDGCYCFVVVRADTMAFFGRTGKQFTNLDGLAPTNLICERIPDGLYITEVKNDELTLEELSGIINPNRVEPLTELQAYKHSKTHFRVHDYLTFEEFIKGESENGYLVRNTLAQELVGYFGFYGIKQRTVYVDSNLETNLHKRKDEVVEKDGEGIVIKDPKALWVAGHKGFRMMKLVRAITYDLLCLGYEEGKGKRSDMVSNLILQWKDGETIKADLGKGWTDEMRIDFWNNPEEYVMKIFEVYALQESSKGKLRLPKVGELRHDKTEPDFCYSF